MLERAALLARKPSACLFDVAPGRGCRVSPCRAAAGFPTTQHGNGRVGACVNMPAPQTRLCGPVPQLTNTLLCPLAGRPLAATPLCGVRTFLDDWHRDCPTCLTASL